MPGQELHQFRVGAAGGHGQRTREVLQERNVRQDRPDAVRPSCSETRGGQSQTPALAHPGQDDLLRIHAGRSLGRLDGAERVQVGPAVVVVLAGIQAARHHARIGHASGRGMWVRGLAQEAAISLAAGVHDEMRIASLRPAGVLLHQAAAAGVADELDHHGQLPGRASARAGPRRQVQPGLDAVPAVPGKRHVEAVDQGQEVPQSVA